MSVLARYPSIELPKGQITSADNWGIWLTALQRLVNAAQRICGQATFLGAGTVAVVFTEGQPDTDYRVAIGPRANENFWITGVGVDGFTLNSSNAASVAVVDWIVVR